MTAALALRRDPATAQIAGVCAAFAQRWGWSPSTVRTLFAILALITAGYAVCIYLAAWALIPRRGETIEPIRAFLPFTQNWSRAALVTTVVATTVGVLGFSGVGPGALAIMGIVWWVMRNSRQTPPSPRMPPPRPTALPRTEFERMSQLWQQRLANIDAGLPADWEPHPVAPAAASYPPPDSTRASASRRRGLRTWLWVVLGLGVAYLATFIVEGLVLPGSGLAWVGTTLAVLGLALVLISRPSRAAFGRPRGLIGATVVTGLVAVGWLGAIQVSGPFGDASISRVSAGSLPVGNTDLGIGEHIVDLGDVEVTQDWPVSYAMDIGSLTVVVPDTGNVRVISAVDMGAIQTPGRSEGGVDLRVVWERIDPDAPSPTLTIRTDLGLGSTEVVG
ncbi:MAG: PspC domain-containing protein [Propioniciclava sp.]